MVGKSAIRISNLLKITNKPKKKSKQTHSHKKPPLNPNRQFTVDTTNDGNELRLLHAFHLSHNFLKMFKIRFETLREENNHNYNIFRFFF